MGLKIEHVKLKNEIYYKLLRPEFIKSWKKPLSSDAFSVRTVVRGPFLIDRDGEAMTHTQKNSIKVSNSLLFSHILRHKRSYFPFKNCLTS